MINKEPLVSIICGYYNREDLIVDSIQSLLDQQYQNTEIIIFDDCSSDSTYERLKLYEEIDQRVKVIKHEKNIGFVQGMINAVQIAKGEYIAVHGSGDISHPVRISKQVEFLQSNPGYGVVSSWKKLSYYSMKKQLSNPGWNGDVTTEHLLKSCPLTHGSTMFRKGVYNQVGGYRSFFKFAQDKDLWLRLSHVSKVYVYPEFLYEQFVPADSVGAKLEKVMVQAGLAKFSSYQFKLRLKYGSDLIDEFGKDAALFFNPLEMKSYFLTLFFKESIYENNELILNQMEKLSHIYNASHLVSIYRFFMRGKLLRSILRRIFSSYLVANPISRFQKQNT